jgi:hypothetical protein
MSKLKVLDLFSGIGGFSLGLERTNGFETVAFCEINQFARNVLALRWPNVKIYDDVRTLNGQRLIEDGIGFPDIIAGGSPCFPKGTLILTKRGLIDISDVVVDDEVWTHVNRWRRVVRLYDHLASTIILRGQGHPFLVTTANHPFLAVAKNWKHKPRKENTTISTPEWTDAVDMHGRFWASPTSITCETPELPKRVVDVEAFFWCLGRWLADGWVVSYRRTSKIPQGSRGSRVNSFATRVLWCANEHKADEVAEKLRLSGIGGTRSKGRDPPTG